LKTFIRSWRETFAFIEFSKSPLSLVIYSEGGDYDSYFRPLLNALSTYKNLQLCYLSSDPTDPYLQEKSDNFSSFYIGKGTARTYLMRCLKADVVIMTMPDLDSFQIKRSPECKNYVYFHHSMVSTHMVYRKSAFDHFDTMLCVGPHHMGEVRKWEKSQGLPAKKLLEHGYGPLDTIREISKFRGMPSKDAMGKLNVLLAPSWGPEGVMETQAVEVVETLLEAGHNVHVRPHPRTFQLARECLINLEKTFSDHPNFEMNRGISEFSALLEAHILISDWSGVAMEFAFGLERPVLFIDVPRKLNNPCYEDIDIVPIEVSYREKVGVVIAPNRVNDIPKTLDIMYEKATDFQSQIQEFRNQNIYHIDKSAQVGANHIYNLLSQDGAT
jgi:YidC/Oxa1 family membrane protein insertase